MNTKEIFKNILEFKPETRTLNWEFGYWAGTLERWYKEGLENKKNDLKDVNYGEGVCGPGLHWPLLSLSDKIPLDSDVSDYFKFDNTLITYPSKHWIFPKFEKKILKEDDKKIELRDIDGIRKIIFKDSSSMPFWIDFPVKDEKDWETIKEEKLNLDNMKERLKIGLGDIEGVNEINNHPVCLFGDPVGFFGSLRFLIGDQNLLLYFYDKPKLIKKMQNYLCDFWINIAEEVLKKSEIDCVFFWEDMSGKNGSLISPGMFKEFLSPCYKRIIDYLKKKGLKHFIVDTDGNVSELIPLFLEVGITGMYPFEVQAGNDILDIRKKYPSFQILGGIDKKALAKSKNSIDRELEKVEKMLTYGGYIPFIDHLVPPDVSWENFIYYREELSKIIFGRK